MRPAPAADGAALPALPYDADHFDYSPWTFWSDASETERDRQLRLQERLRTERGYVVGRDCFVSAKAAIQNESLRLGEDSYVAAGAYLSGDVTVGDHCSINPYAVVRGDIRIGDWVRIGAHTSIIAFNHVIDDPDVPFAQQGLTARGVTIGDDVWVGSHVVVLDGVDVGSRSVLAAGAVVTKDVPAGAIVGGNPARVLKWRVPALRPEPAGDGPGTTSRPGTSGNGAETAADCLEATVSAFADRARTDASALLERCWDPATGLFGDRPEAEPTVRAQCDAIEIADLLLGGPPTQIPADEQAARLRSWQDPRSGLVAGLGADGGTPTLDDGDAAYHVLSVGYALDLLGSAFPAPVGLRPADTATDVTHWLDALPWQHDPWGAGAQVDALGTALTWNRLGGHGNPSGVEEALLGWLITRVDPGTGLWGRVDHDDLLLPVNGWYRAVRGTFGQLGVPVPHPERVVDTVLRHLADPSRFSPDRWNACNLLDVAYPLWLTRRAAHRQEEVTGKARELLVQALRLWTPGQGTGFAARGDSSVPGLQGTEMWLAIVWYLADLAGVSDHLGYRPRGVHRPEPRR
ncbi:hypothetical protein GCM10028784_05260 [Myceligenerans cantabricum]